MKRKDAMMQRRQNHENYRHPGINRKDPKDAKREPRMGFEHETLRNRTRSAAVFGEGTLPMNLGPPASLPAWQSARNTPAGMPAVPTTRRFMAGEQVRTEHETFHEPYPLERQVQSAAPLREHGSRD